MRKLSLALLALCFLFYGCDWLAPEVSITVDSFEQAYYKTFGGYSDLVQIFYTIKNTGSVTVDYYEVWFEAICFDGTKYEDWTNGLNLPPGRSISDSMFITVPHKQVSRIRLVDYELSNY